MILPFKVCPDQSEQKRRRKPCELVAARAGRVTDLSRQKTGENVEKTRWFR
jgi:hypothetical protein